MSISLYEHQIKAIEQLKNGDILCGGVGSGKSRTALAYYYMKVCGGGIPINSKGKYLDMTNPIDIYIITTARKRDTLDWEKEAVPFLISNDREIGIQGTKLHVDSWNNIKKYINIKGAFFIFDEQRVIGYGAWTKAFLQITKQNKWILLSATPGDVWLDYLPVFIANGFYKNKTDFVRQHVVYNRFAKFPMVDKYIDVGKLIKYRDSLLIHMIFDRHTIRHTHIVKVEHDKETERFIIKNRWNPFENKPIENASEYTHTLRKVINSHPSRVDAVVRLAKKHKRMIVFYKYNFELDILRSRLTEEKIIFAEWNGHKHEPIPKTKKWIYLVQYTSGSEGWNCIETDTMIFYSLDHSYRVMQQAMGRIDRLNTPYVDLHYYELRSNSRVDLGILKSLKSKKNFNMSAFYKTK